MYNQNTKQIQMHNLYEQELNLQSTFGNRPSNQRSDLDHSQTRIKVLSSFQQSYLQDKKSYISDHSNRPISPNLQIQRESQKQKELEQEIKHLKQQILKEEMQVAMEKEVHTFLISHFNANTINQQSSIRKSKIKKANAANTYNLAYQYLQFAQILINNIESLQRMD